MCFVLWHMQYQAMLPCTDAGWDVMSCTVRVPPGRYQLLRGKRAKFVPGWDTHGLPIELKVLQSLPDKERKALVSTHSLTGGMMSARAMWQG